MPLKCSKCFGNIYGDYRTCLECKSHFHNECVKYHSKQKEGNIIRSYGFFTCPECGAENQYDTVSTASRTVKMFSAIILIELIVGGITLIISALGILGPYSPIPIEIGSPLYNDANILGENGELRTDIIHLNFITLHTFYYIFIATLIFMFIMTQVHFKVDSEISKKLFIFSIILSIGILLTLIIFYFAVFPNSLTSHVYDEINNDAHMSRFVEEYQIRWQNTLNSLTSSIIANIVLFAIVFMNIFIHKARVERNITLREVFLIPDAV